MPLSWNEIRHRAIAFSKEWVGVRRENAEKQTFWNEFFDVFGIKRRVLATFEEPVQKISGEYGFIDLFWPGTLLVEHKSAGEYLGKAKSQAFRYIQDLIHEGRTDEIPRTRISTELLTSATGLADSKAIASAWNTSSRFMSNLRLRCCLQREKAGDQ